MRKFIVFNATIALCRARRIFGSNTFAKRASNVWMAIWEWGISPQGGLFLQALRQVSDHVDMVRALCFAGLVQLGAGFLLSLDIPLESGEDCSTVITTTINKVINNIFDNFDSMVSPL
jgi:hypothetical protein